MTYLNKIMKMYWQLVGQFDIGKTKSGKPRGYKRRLSSILKEDAGTDDFVKISHRPYNRSSLRFRGTEISSLVVANLVGEIIEHENMDLTRILIKSRYSLLGNKIYMVVPFSYREPIGHLKVKASNYEKRKGIVGLLD